MATSIPAPCDASIAESIAARPGARPGLTLLASILASSLAFIDGSSVNVALPAIQQGLGADASGLQWVVNAYLLPLSALLLLGGAAGDRFGRRRLFLLGIALFAVASVVCLAATTLPALLAGRVLQGIGAALLLPNSLALLGGAFSGEARGRAIGTWAAAGAIAGAIGPMIGGWLVETAGWRFIFVINLPLCAGALWLGWRTVAETAADREGALDWLGVVLATAGLAGITWALTALTTPDAEPGLAEAAVLALGAASIAAFVRVEARRGERAIMPLALFGTGSFIGLTLLTFLLYGALGGLLVLLPYLLIESRGYDAFTAGAALLPFPLVLGLASRSVGALAARGNPRLLLTAGPAVTAVGFLVLALAPGGASYWTAILPGLLLIAIGMAGAVAPLTNAVMAAVDDHHVGTANGFNSAIARTGGMIATALVGPVLSAAGAALPTAFSVAAVVGAALSASAALAAALLLRTQEIRHG